MYLLRFILTFVVLFNLSQVQAQCISGGCFDGPGKLRLPDGSIYEGNFLKGEISDYGKITYLDGANYKGYFLQRRFEGQGTFTLANGKTRTGLWHKGQPVNAEGILESDDKNFTSKGTSAQVGCISGKCDNDYGIYLYADGSKYEGHFKNKRPNNEGQMFYADGGVYTGQYKLGLRHGKGSYMALDGTATTGDWQEDNYIGFATEPTKKAKKGCISGNCVDGQGEYVFNDGQTRYKGQFVNGKPSGIGTIYYSSGARYFGNWANGKFNGFGTLIEPGQPVLEGNWALGEFQDANPSTAPTKSDPPSPLPKKNIDAPLPKPKKQPRVWAVIVGVADYVHMPSLKYTDDDAYMIHSFLCSPEGGSVHNKQIQILINDKAQKDSILYAISSIQPEPDDLVFIYMSGHGIRGAFLPIDFDGYKNQLLFADLTEAIAKVPCNRKLIIVDACHSGGILASRDGLESENLYYDKLSNSEPGAAFLLSSHSNESSVESNILRHGVFSHFVIEGLRGFADTNSNNVVSIAELSHFVIEGVKEYTNGMQSSMVSGTFDPDMPVAIIRR